MIPVNLIYPNPLRKLFFTRAFYFLLKLTFVEDLPPTV